MSRLHSVAWILICGLAAAGCSGSGGGGSSSGSSTAAGVTTGTTTGGGTTTTPPAPRMPAPGAWYKGDLHSHSATHSEDARRQLGDPIATTVRVAENVGLDFLAGTDHRTNDVITDPNFSSQTLVLLPGMEWGGAMHAGAIGLTAPIPVNTTQTGAGLTPEIDGIIAEIHRQGGVFVLNHPCEQGNKLWLAQPADFDAIEVWNSQWSMREWKPRTQADLDAKMLDLGLTQAGVAPNPHMVAAIADQRGAGSLQALTFYESYLNAGRRIALVGGGDRHMLLPQGSPTTHVYAATRDRQGVLDGIRACRTYVSRKPSGPLVDFTADEDGDGIYEALLGDEVASGGNVKFRVVVEGAAGGFLEVVKRGVVIRSEPILAQTHVLMVDDIPAPGDWYRVDVYEAIDPQVAQTKGAILRLAQASNQPWAVIGALLTMVGSGSFDGTQGTVLPIIIVPDEVDKLLNASLKDPGYARGAMTSPIFVR